jgi:hypothetical protein
MSTGIQPFKPIRSWWNAGKRDPHQIFSCSYSLRGSMWCISVSRNVISPYKDPVLNGHLTGRARHDCM